MTRKRVNMSDNTFFDDDLHSDVVAETRLPRQFRVLLHNDHYTTMEFVVQILIEVFGKTIEQATTIMLAVHEKGIGECGVSTSEIAETKITVVHTRARKVGFPLRCSMEEA